MIYFDSSALIKLIAPEPESPALSSWVRERLERRRATSALAKVDVMRRFRVDGPAAEDLAEIVLSKLDQLPVEQEVLDQAAELRFGVGPVDAVHLATAMAEPTLHAYLSYDPVLLDIAGKLGLRTASPGFDGVLV
ncbi:MULTISPECIES: type II toxin-antitoxin system VapC family toxin [Saccharopolyspora]|uniref:Type II toxin-antitoxin system VapC family toxin n=1 Tax=Saccharopolyspora cebuensis TaxID=418759 RepID=A0ABV4CIP1_9PSEU